MWQTLVHSLSKYVSQIVLKCAVVKRAISSLPCYVVCNKIYLINIQYEGIQTIQDLNSHYRNKCERFTSETATRTFSEALSLCLQQYLKFIRLHQDIVTDNIATKHATT